MKKFLQHIGHFFTNLFGSEYAFLKANSKIAVDITNTLKAIVENPITNLVVELIPGDLDNKILEKLKVIVPRVAAEMAIAHQIIQTAASNSQVYDGIISHLKDMNKDARVGFWLEFSGRLNQALADGKITMSEAVVMAQLVYDEFYDKK